MRMKMALGTVAALALLALAGAERSLARVANAQLVQGGAVSTTPPPGVEPLPVDRAALGAKLGKASGARLEEAGGLNVVL